MPVIDWDAIPAGIIAAIIAAVASLGSLVFAARIATAAKRRDQRDAAEIQREIEDHNDLLTFRRELQDEGSRRLRDLRETEALVRAREAEVHALRQQLLTEREAHGSRVGELERKLALAEHALAKCQEAYSALSNKQMEE